LLGNLVHMHMLLGYVFVLRESSITTEKKGWKKKIEIEKEKEKSKTYSRLYI
jgi:hypothetical protein